MDDAESCRRGGRLRGSPGRADRATGAHPRALTERRMTGRPGSTVALAAVLACSSRAAPPATPMPVAAAACTAGDTAMVRDVVYFGRNRPGGGTVNDADWQRFLDEVVTPRFPNGLTVVDATGR